MYIKNSIYRIYAFVKKWRILLLLVIVGYIVAELVVGFTKGSRNYNPSIFILLLIICEVTFNLGVLLMLVGSGVFKNWRDVFRFNFENVRFGNKTSWLGFHINRLAALTPFVYLLVSGYKTLPLYISILVVIDIGITMLVYLEVRRKLNDGNTDTSSSDC